MDITTNHFKSDLNFKYFCMIYYTLHGKFPNQITSIVYTAILCKFSLNDDNNDYGLVTHEL